MKSADPKLDLRFRPRLSYYLDGEPTGTFIVDAPLTHDIGQVFQQPSVNYTSNATSRLFIDIVDDQSQAKLVSAAPLIVNSTSNQYNFSLSDFIPRAKPFGITLTARSSNDSKSAYSASTQLYLLPQKQGQGSLARLDSLTDAIMYSANAAKSWTPVFPYAFYTSWSDALQGQPDTVNMMKDAGYNMIHAIPDPDYADGFDPAQLDQYLTRSDEVGMLIMYDMRGTYQNASSVARQLALVKDHPSLLLWYTADEPDGNSDPLNATSLAYKQIRDVDPYHPVSLVLNCYNFHYEEYTRGADIVLEDVYPISTNTSFAARWGTPCNATYGCCGCDDCHGSLGDISERLDKLADYHRWLGGPPKPRWGVPQAFGASEYWTRVPTADEEVAMTLLRMQHGAAGIVMWTWPTTDELANVTSRLGKVLTGTDVTEFTLGTTPVPLSVQGSKDVDAAGWILDDEMLVSVTNTFGSTSGPVSLQVPSKEKASSIGPVFWGSAWTLEKGALSKASMAGFESDLFLIKLQ